MKIKRPTSHIENEELLWVSKEYIFFKIKQNLFSGIAEFKEIITIFSEFIKDAAFVNQISFRLGLYKQLNIDTLKIF